MKRRRDEGRETGDGGEGMQKCFRLFSALFCLFLATSFFPVHAQKKTPFFIPTNTTMGINSNFHWFMYEGLEGNWVDQVYASARLRYSDKLDLVFVDKARSENGTWKNKVSDIYFDYHNTFSANPRIPIFKYGTYLNLKFGMFEWYPTFTNVQQILEHADWFINPPQIYGASIISVTPLTKDNALTAHLSANGGDLLFKKTDPELHDLYLNYTKIFKHHLGVSAQAGIAEGSVHTVNYAYFMYLPKWESLQFDIKVGKLPTVDETPYGFHLGIIRNFKYISLGGYYERRLHQDTKGEIAGIQWSIIGPPKVVKIVSAFNIFYDFNTTTLWMYIPVMKVDIKHK